jgi:hypothetical protein
MMEAIHSSETLVLTRTTPHNISQDGILQNALTSNTINIFHQNIRGLRSKHDELLHSFEIDNINPHILCLSEHHMVEQEL